MLRSTVAWINYVLNLIKKPGSLHNAFLYGDVTGSELMSTERVNIKALAPPFVTIYQDL